MSFHMQHLQPMRHGEFELQLSYLSRFVFTDLTGTCTEGPDILE